MSKITLDPELRAKLKGLNLADIWNNAADRAAVTTAAIRIDDYRTRAPLGHGEAR